MTTTYRFTDDSHTTYTGTDAPNVFKPQARAPNGAAIQPYAGRGATATDVKAEAGRRILADYSTTAQANYQARAMELVLILAQGGTLSVGERAEIPTIRGVRADILAVRTASNAIEAELGTMTVAQMVAHSRWPS